MTARAWTFLAFLALVASTGAAGRAVLVVGQGLNEPFGVSFDTAGNLYLVEMGGNRVRVLGRDGKPSVLAGRGEKGAFGIGGPPEACSSTARTERWCGPGPARSSWPTARTTG